MQNYRLKHVIVFLWHFSNVLLSGWGPFIQNQDVSHKFSVNCYEIRTWYENSPWHKAVHFSRLSQPVLFWIVLHVGLSYNLAKTARTSVPKVGTHIYLRVQELVVFFPFFVQISFSLKIHTILVIFGNF